MRRLPLILMQQRPRPALVLPSWVGTDNLFTAPTDLSNGAWTRNNLVAHSTATGYAGETASVMQEAADTAQQHSVTQSVTVTSGVTYIYRAVVKAGSGARWTNMVLPATRFTSATAASFSVNDGSVLAVSNTPGEVVQYLGDRNFLVSITKAATSTGAASILFRMHNGTSVVYDGDGTSSIIVTALGLHVV